jgi:hypothetical protein
MNYFFPMKKEKIESRKISIEEIKKIRATFPEDHREAREIDRQIEAMMEKDKSQ